MKLRGTVLALVVVGLLHPGNVQPEAGQSGFDEALAAELAEAQQPPDWWESVQVRLPPDVDAEDLAAQLEFVRAAYAEKGRTRQAIRLYADIADRARDGEERIRLRAFYELAHLYEVFEKDPVRAFAWYLRCYRFPLADATEARQNRIAAELGSLRALSVTRHRRSALAALRLLASNLVLAPDAYGNLLLPEVFLRIGDLAVDLGDSESASTAYQAAMAAAERLPEATPINYRAPWSSARASLRRLSALSLDFARVPDGSYEGEAYGYNEPITVGLSFRDGRCTEFHLPDFGDKRPLDAYRILPRRVLERQSLAVDAVTGATVTSRAILSAATEAVFQSGKQGAEHGR
jgi:uncharacterized protein with FMN-binding domain